MSNACNTDELASHNINYVLNVSGFKRSTEYPIETKTLNVPISDFGFTNLFDVLDTCFNFIDEAKGSGGKVLVHCMAGINRSASICIAYLMKQRQWTLKQAYDFLKKIRDEIHPHPSYMEQLFQYEEKLFGTKKGTISIDAVQMQ